jgi:hypothetical protein
MKKQTDFPLTLRGNRARTDAKIQELWDEVERLKQRETRNIERPIVSPKMDGCRPIRSMSEINDDVLSIKDRLRLVYILTGIAFGAALIFSIILLGAIMNVGSGG